MDVATGSKRRRLDEESASIQQLKAVRGEQGGAGGLDLISRLPDDILGDVITLLPTNEGARMQVLSRRWRSAPLNFEAKLGTAEGKQRAAAILCAHRPGPARRFSSTWGSHLRDEDDDLHVVDTLIRSPGMDGLQELELYCTYNAVIPSCPAVGDSPWPAFGLPNSHLLFFRALFIAVLQLSENFRLHLGPFRYVVAGLLKYLSLPQYRFEVDYLPSSPGKNSELKPLTEKCHEQLSDDAKVRRDIQTNGRFEDDWVTRKGEFLGIFVCNHFCKPARGLLSPVIAPKAQHDDGSLDLILVHGNGRLRLFCFFVAYQLCWHLLLPYVEYVKVKEVKIRPVGDTHNGCGVDGELLHGEGKTEWQCSLLRAQGRLLGRDHGALK